MKVFKFGGASVRNADAIRKVGNVIQSFSDQPLLVVVSAIGKTTNRLEQVVFHNQPNQPPSHQIEDIFEEHSQITTDLFEPSHPIHSELSSIKSLLLNELQKPYQPDQMYDQVVSLGEVISTMIVCAYLNKIGISAEWIDARNFIVTDDTFREARVDWVESENRIRKLSNLLNKNIVVTQGFIGATGEQLTTTLGREGSDFSAAIFASCLNASSVTIWKDVPGVMSADPKRIPDATTFDELPFREAAEMTYYGASVIHPKTIKPLANKGIPLFVKNFDDIHLPGTRIHECKVDHLPPLIVFKDNQCLVSCHVTDYTFVDESQISIIFNALSGHNLKVNMMQNSAISFSFCLDFRAEKVMALIADLSKCFEVYYNTGLTLVTVKNYDKETFEKYRTQKNVVLEQSSRSTLQVLVKS